MAHWYRRLPEAQRELVDGAAVYAVLGMCALLSVSAGLLVGWFHAASPHVSPAARFEMFCLVRRLDEVSLKQVRRLARLARDTDVPLRVFLAPGVGSIERSGGDAGARGDGSAGSARRFPVEGVDAVVCSPAAWRTVSKGLVKFPCTILMDEKGRVMFVGQGYTPVGLVERVLRRRVVKKNDRGGY